MPKSFLREYLMADSTAVLCPRDVPPTAWASALFRYRKRLWTLNPWKLVACRHLLHIHAMRKDKVRCPHVVARSVSPYLTHFSPPGLDFFR